MGIKVAWHGEGANEFGIAEDVDGPRLAHACNGYGLVGRNGVDADGAIRPGQTLVRVDARYFRPTEVVSLLGDASRARTTFGWEPVTLFGDLVHEMVWADLLDAQKFDCLLENGLPIIHRHDS